MLEALLFAHGIQPTVTDSEARWQKERNRASDLGAQALILVGASRMQIDVDLDEARRLTGLEPVQLAVSGANWIPIFQGLAADPEIRGTVLVDVDEKYIAEPDTEHTNVVNEALIYQEHFQRRHGRPSPSDQAEEWLGDRLRSKLRSYADDATPWQSLVYRAFAGADSSQYITTGPDRSRAADFSRVPDPAVLLPLSLRNLGRNIPLSYKQSVETRRAELQRAVAALQPEDNSTFVDETRTLRSMVEAIANRGGRVYFIRMPQSGWAAESNARRFPRLRFWDQFAEGIGAPTLNSSDVESLSGFPCPDAFHLDYRDRTNFTAALISALSLSPKMKSP